MAVLCLGAALLAAQVDLLLHDRLRRAWQRARTYLAMHMNPVLRRQTLHETSELLTDARALEALLPGDTG